jgi:hypothetical protein
LSNREKVALMIRGFVVNRAPCVRCNGKADCYGVFTLGDRHLARLALLPKDGEERLLCYAACRACLTSADFEGWIEATATRGHEPFCDWWGDQAVRRR